MCVCVCREVTLREGGGKGKKKVMEYMLNESRKGKETVGESRQQQEEGRREKRATG